MNAFDISLLTMKLSLTFGTAHNSSKKDTVEPYENDVAPKIIIY
jgi:hypothetical protein